MKIDIGATEEAKFEMAPMIDMVFLLLVFFMMASQMAQLQNKKMEIPEATKAVVPKERPNRWIVNITANGDIFEGLEPIDVKGLTKRVSEQVKMNPKLKVYLRADVNTKHKEVKKVMAAMAKAGVSDFIFGVFVKDK